MGPSISRRMQATIGAPVQPAAEERADGHVAHQVRSHGILKTRAQLRHRLVFPQGLLGRPRLELPVGAGRADTAGIADEQVAGRQLVHAAEHVRGAGTARMPRYDRSPAGSTSHGTPGYSRSAVTSDANTSAPATSA